jgi:hypothetical protein
MHPLHRRFETAIVAALGDEIEVVVDVVRRFQAPRSSGYPSFR